ncbi:MULTISPECIES: hypothetical protein [Methanosarcina]|uniref:Uncharacterized protein n=1 Tax=Methanosarcina barkeri CM1 TaxID=796385 RepID=A0A0G3CH59_METBA|nr:MULTISPECIES: hypothetical protein [Methanosarcina]AKJ38442.1 hypothetical protein MCM1_1392 [Methanosarcina barkeri CM1]OED05775.1 hypothetical protein A9239_12295 [Methanosarcina sp. A14]
MIKNEMAFGIGSKDKIARQDTSRDFQSKYANISERTISVAYDSRITDAYFIQITLLKTKYKTVEKLGRIF